MLPSVCKLHHCSHCWKIQEHLQYFRWSCSHCPCDHYTCSFLQAFQLGPCQGNIHALDYLCSPLWTHYNNNSVCPPSLFLNLLQSVFLGFRIVFGVSWGVSIWYTMYLWSDSEGSSNTCHLQTNLILKPHISLTNFHMPAIAQESILLLNIPEQDSRICLLCFVACSLGTPILPLSKLWASLNCISEVESRELS